MRGCAWMPAPLTPVWSAPPGQPPGMCGPWGRGGLPPPPHVAGPACDDCAWKVGSRLDLARGRRGERDAIAPHSHSGGGHLGTHTLSHWQAPLVGLAGCRCTGLIAEVEGMPQSTA